MTTKLTITNITDSPQRVYTVEGQRLVGPRQSLTAEFEDHEADNVKANTSVFRKGKLDDGFAAPAAPEVDAAALTADARRAALDDIASLFGSADINADNVKDAVSHLIDEFKALKDHTEIKTDTSLADAVAKLDHANDKHWTQAGLPDLSAVSDIYGKPVTRADIDALTPKTLRAKPTA